MQGIGDMVFRATDSGMILYAIGPQGSLSAIAVSAAGLPTPIATVQLPAATLPGAQPRIELVPTPQGDHLFVTAGEGAGAWQIALGPTGAPGTPQSLPAGLAGARSPGDLVAVAVNGKTLLATAGSGGASLWTLGDGGLTGQQPLSPASPTGTGINAVAGLSVGGASFLVCLSASGDSVGLHHVQIDGTQTVTSRIGAAEGIGIDLPGAVVTANVGGRAFAVIGGSGSSSLTVVEIRADGTMTATDHVLDDLFTRFDGVTALAVAQVGTRAFVAAAGSDDGVSLFELLPDGTLLLHATLADSAETTMANVSVLAMTATGQTLRLAVSSTAEAGVTLLSFPVGAGGVIAGGTAAESLSGGVGSDILMDGPGSDTLRGGAEADIFVLAADGSPDTIADFQPGVDRIDLSRWVLLRNPGQVMVVPLSDGAELRFGSEVLRVVTASGAPLSAAALLSGGLLNLSRLPPGWFGLDSGTTLAALPEPPGPLLLDGSPGDDIFRGGPENDTLLGSDGNDLLDGGPGDDRIDGGDGTNTLQGGDGSDTLLGGTGKELLDGGPGNDLVRARAGDDTVRGGPGNDTLFGDDGNDSLEGEDGNDRLWGGPGRDTLRGGIGNDILMGEADPDLLIGGPGDDTLMGGGATNTLRGEDGNDWISGGLARDQIEGGAGNDTIFGFGGSDAIDTGPGDDLVVAHSGADVVIGGLGNDTLRGGAGPDSLFGGDGNDLLEGHAQDDELRGGSGNDTLSGGPHNDTLWGEAGDDLLRGDVGTDVLHGGDGNDTLSGGSHNDSLSGDAGDDSLRGDIGADTLHGGLGNDTLEGGNQNDLLWGDAGNDLLRGGNGLDTLHGGDGQDRLQGEDAADALFGGAGNDTLEGGTWNDTLDGGPGNDVLIGGLGADVFVYGVLSSGRDVIQDFQPGVDRLRLDADLLPVPDNPLLVAQVTTAGIVFDFDNHRVLTLAGLADKSALIGSIDLF